MTALEITETETERNREKQNEREKRERERERERVLPECNFHLLVGQEWQSEKLVS